MFVTLLKRLIVIVSLKAFSWERGVSDLQNKRQKKKKKKTTLVQHTRRSSSRQRHLLPQWCFIFIDSPKSWPEAEGYCLYEGANLASVHSYDENHFIQDLTRGNTHNFPETWIGGHDAIYPCFWMWSDGTKFDYENFLWDYEKERPERCLKMNYGFAGDWQRSYASCNNSLPFVCSKRI